MKTIREHPRGQKKTQKENPKQQSETQQDNSKKQMKMEQRKTQRRNGRNVARLKRNCLFLLPLARCAANSSIPAAG